MMHVSMKFHEILFIHLEVMVQTRKKAYLSSILVTLTVGTYKWHMTHRLVMMHVSMKFHEILFNRLEVAVRTSEYLRMDTQTLPYHNTSRFVKTGSIKRLNNDLKRTKNRKPSLMKLDNVCKRCLCPRLGN